MIGCSSVLVLSAVFLDRDERNLSQNAHLQHLSHIRCVPISTIKIVSTPRRAFERPERMLPFLTLNSVIGYQYNHYLTRWRVISRSIFLPTLPEVCFLFHQSSLCSLQYCNLIWLKRGGGGRSVGNDIHIL